MVLGLIESIRMQKWSRKHKHVEALILLSFSWLLCIAFTNIHLAFNPLCSFQLPSFYSLIIRAPIVNGKDTWRQNVLECPMGKLTRVHEWGWVPPLNWMKKKKKKIVVGGSLRLMIVFSTTSVPPVLLCLSLHALCCPPLHTFGWLLLEFAFTMCPMTPWCGTHFFSSLLKP